MRQSLVRFWQMDILAHFRDIYIRVYYRVLAVSIPFIIIGIDWNGS